MQTTLKPLTLAILALIIFISDILDLPGALSILNGSAIIRSSIRSRMQR